MKWGWRRCTQLPLFVGAIHESPVFALFGGSSWVLTPTGLFVHSALPTEEGLVTLSRFYTSMMTGRIIGLRCVF